MANFHALYTSPVYQVIRNYNYTFQAISIVRLPLNVMANNKTMLGCNRDGIVLWSE